MTLARWWPRRRTGGDRGHYAPLNDTLTAEQVAAGGLPIEWPDDPSPDDAPVVTLPRDVAIDMAMALLLYGYGFARRDDGAVSANDDVLNDAGATARRLIDLLPPDVHGEAYIRAH